MRGTLAAGGPDAWAARLYSWRTERRGANVVVTLELGWKDSLGNTRAQTLVVTVNRTQAAYLSASLTARG